MANPVFVLEVIFLCLFLKAYFSLAADTISANQSLSGLKTIVSKGGVVQLGFFSPRGDSDYYLGISLLMDSSRQVVWVANREKPVSFYSNLRISDGNLVLFDESNQTIWSTSMSNSRTTARSVQAVLLDTGNLVLNDIGSNSFEPLWQSFDHPTNVFLPGAKIGYNRITNTSQILTSWKNSNDPAPGLYTLHFDPSDKSFNLQWNRSKIYWTSGAWNEQSHSFSFVPEMRLDYIFNYSFVSNQNESYFTYSLYSNPKVDISRLVMDVSGQIKQVNLLMYSGLNLFWAQPRQQCKVYAFCGAYGSCNENSLPFCSCLWGFDPKSQTDWDLQDYSGGCIRKAKWRCENSGHANGEIDRFYEIPSLSLPEDEQLVGAGSFKECESTCLSSCSCTAYAYNNNSCSIWTGSLLNLKQVTADDSNGRTLYIRLAASEFHSPKKESKKLFTIIFGTTTAALLVSCTLCSVYYWRRKLEARNQGNRGYREVGLYGTEKQIIDFILSGQFGEDEKKGIDVPSVALESIIAATDNFSEANKLGRGGFGPVHKGKFPGGQEIAIKRLSSGSGQGLEEFKNEVLMIAKLQHRNLVRLLGYCVEGDEKMLLYEYMPNKSLDTFVFDQTLGMLLNWEIRFNIILGIARGLQYLHHDSRLRIIHRDLKTSNVLLDEEMNPKISDFGLARIFGGKQTEANTRRVVGTYGYMSPEYALDGVFSIKSDVFSFGVMILEIISGKRNTGFYQSEQALSLLGYAWKLWRGSRPLDLMDAILSKTCNANEFLRCANVGLLCVQDDPSDRPTMANVVSMLGSETAILSSPKQPAFVTRRSLSSTGYSNKPLSVNALTASLEQGR